MNIYFVYLGISVADKVNRFNYLPKDQKILLIDPLLEALSEEFKQTTLPKDISDILVRVALLLVIARMILGGKITLLLARRLSYLIGFLYLLRIPFMMMTLFPNPLLDCIPDINPNIFENSLELLFQQKASCGDLMFSGHTVMFMISSLVWIDYPVAKMGIARILITVIILTYGILSILSLIASSYHYTIDVVVSVIVCLTTWKLYHFLVQSKYFDDTWYGRFFLFIDQEQYMLLYKKHNHILPMYHNTLAS
ncbi:hypothetical protein K502DRAFT_302762 [Neoconidiobolus thromboides FSU 785]|nr:hypothetical protein K502DRAFT_302762 [Neoconidiobolus thromboides FSU 785]